MNDDRYDLTFVAPHRRDEARRRIAVVERFLDIPPPRSDAEARLAARELGISRTTFNGLAKAWQDRRQPDLLPGLHRRKPRGSPVTEAQRQIVMDAARERPNQPLSAVVARAREISAERGLPIPTAENTIRKIAGEIRRASIAEASLPGSADIAIMHCVLDIPVDLAGSAVMPLAALVVTTGAASPSIAGVALTLGLATAGLTARALLSATAIAKVGSGDLDEGIIGDLDDYRASTSRIAYDRFDEAGWDDLEKVLLDAGFEVEASLRRTVNRGTTAVALIGPRPARIALKPGLGTRPAAERAASLPSGASGMQLAEAEKFVLERFASIGTPRREGLASLSAPQTRRDLSRIALDFA